jgi:energy-coupling factor transporter transmembrane protein EcfT
MASGDPVRSVATLHAATLLALWLMWLLAGQRVGTAGHGAWALASVLFACVFARVRFLRLMLRLRWLFLAILLTFGLGTPGRLIIPDFPAGPSSEGVLLAWRAMFHLAAMAACVAVLLAGLTPGRLTGAMHRLIHPFSACHPGADSFALRLQLVLAELERPAPEGRWVRWLDLPASDGPLLVEPCAPLGWADAFVLGVGVAMLLLWIGF